MYISLYEVISRPLALFFTSLAFFAMTGCAHAPKSEPEAPRVRLVAAGTMITGRVVGVTDGDTLTLLDGANNQHKIRLAGIDAPEKAQPFGNRSKQHLSGLTFQKDATALCGKVDRYGREVCKVFTGGVDANLEQVRAGMAWHYKDYAREQTEADRTAYAGAEEAARTQRAGLWTDARPVEPWKWRKDPNTRTAEPRP